MDENGGSALLLKEKKPCRSSVGTQNLKAIEYKAPCLLLNLKPPLLPRKGVRKGVAFPFVRPAPSRNHTRINAA